MSDQLEATRVTTYQGHRCRCVLVLPSGYSDRCPSRVRVPDQPCCDECERFHSKPADPRVICELSTEP